MLTKAKLELQLHKRKDGDSGLFPAAPGCGPAPALICTVKHDVVI